ncbi:hypothetical protein U14_00889 [Candidatus Moduliflexus flocculans]|uniref:Uncharacterized protein n=1 Tax=Candidatus Moduliflexus flocculans TaxID=1499966 RepID=A0A0S6VR81_9BACT|nr:hypothetical protein U14_00889 [Candidatus Moduliflexus flocculans]
MTSLNFNNLDLFRLISQGFRNKTYHVFHRTFAFLFHVTNKGSTVVLYTPSAPRLQKKLACKEDHSATLSFLS